MEGQIEGSRRLGFSHGGLSAMPTLPFKPTPTALAARRYVIEIVFAREKQR